MLKNSDRIAPPGTLWKTETTLERQSVLDAGLDNVAKQMFSLECLSVFIRGIFHSKRRPRNEINTLEGVEPKAKKFERNSFLYGTTQPSESFDPSEPSEPSETYEPAAIIQQGELFILR